MANDVFENMMRSTKRNVVLTQAREIIKDWTEAGCFFYPVPVDFEYKLAARLEKMLDLYIGHLEDVAKRYEKLAGGKTVEAYCFDRMNTAYHELNLRLLNDLENDYRYCDGTAPKETTAWGFLGGR